MRCCNSAFPVPQSSLASSSIAGLFTELFGTGENIYKDPVTGKWTFEEVIGFPKQSEEGVIDYILRILGSGNILFNKGVWQSGTSYCKGSLVAYNGKYWVAQIQTTSIPSNPNWSELLYSLEGLQGPAGDDGFGNTITT
jgi:hypothetical protein